MHTWQDAEFVGVQAMQKDAGYEIQRPILHLRDSIVWFVQMDVNAADLNILRIHDFRKGVKEGRYLSVEHPPQAERGYLPVVASPALVRALSLARLDSALPWCSEHPTGHRIAYVTIEAAAEWGENLPRQITRWAARAIRQMILSDRKDAGWQRINAVLFAAWDLFNPDDGDTIGQRQNIGILLGIVQMEGIGVDGWISVVKRAIHDERLFSDIGVFGKTVAETTRRLCTVRSVG